MRFVFSLLLLVFILGCKSDKKQVDNISLEWEEVDLPVQGKAMHSFLFSDNDNMLISWMEKVHDSITTLNYAEFRDNKWSNPVKIIEGNNWFVNWADFPAIAYNKGNILSHFLQKSDVATFAYDIYLKQFNQEKNTWLKPNKVHSDTTKTEHGFVTLLPYGEDRFFTTWLDGRKTSGGHDHSGAGGMTIRAAEILLDGTKEHEVELDAKTCDCCQTSAAITQNGPIVVYRNRFDDEIRDIYIARFIDGDWTLPKAIYNDNWKIKGCPVNGPKVVAKDKNVAVTWFTEANRNAKVNVIFSNDNGKTFGNMYTIDSGSSIGRVDVVFLDVENVLVSWLELNETYADIMVAKINIAKGKVKETIVDTISSSRASGFPQLEIFKEYVYVSFNKVDENTKTIKMKRIAKSYFID